jgi:menaquinone-dependent protoporphyrinogen oxidase
MLKPGNYQDFTKFHYPYDFDRKNYYILTLSSCYGERDIMPTQTTRRKFLNKGCLIAAGAGVAVCAGGGVFAAYQPKIDMPSAAYGDPGSNQRVLLTYASKAGSTAEVAVKMGQMLAQRSLQIDVRPLASVTGLAPYQAVVLGSAIRTGSLLPEALTFIQQNQSVLQQKAFSVFILCMTLATDNEANRTKVGAYLDPVRALVKPASAGLFAGVMDLNKLKGIERLIILAMKTPIGDFRQWDQIGAWAENIVV